MDIAGIIYLRRQWCAGDLFPYKFCHVLLCVVYACTLIATHCHVNDGVLGSKNGHAWIWAIVLQPVQNECRAVDTILHTRTQSGSKAGYTRLDFFFIQPSWIIRSPDLAIVLWQLALTAFWVPAYPKSNCSLCSVKNFQSHFEKAQLKDWFLLKRVAPIGPQMLKCWFKYCPRGRSQTQVQYGQHPCMHVTFTHHCIP